jgi:uncharacterized protein YndB with AHSA1/START domain
MTVAPRRKSASERGFTILRTFNAPAPAVYRLWTDPVLVAQWWGIRDCTIPSCELDVRVGGHWRIDMLTASGKLYRNQGVYRHVLENRYLEYTDVPDPELSEWAGSPPGLGVHAVSFEAEDDVTHVTFGVTVASPLDRSRLLALGMRRGWMQSFDRLAVVLESLSIGGPNG